MDSLASTLEFPDPLSPTKAARRESIVLAAMRVFLERGIEGTTMEGIADASGVSKVTLYTYFSDKDAVFHECARLWIEQIKDVALAAHDPTLPPTERVRKVLIAKQGTVYEIAHSSQFSDQLMAAKAKVPDLMREIDAEIVEKLAEDLGDGDLARILFHASLGLVDGATSRANLERDISRMVDALVPESVRGCTN